MTSYFLHRIFLLSLSIVKAEIIHTSLPNNVQLLYKVDSGTKCDMGKRVFSTKLYVENVDNFLKQNAEILVILQVFSNLRLVFHILNFVKRFSTEKR